MKKGERKQFLFAASVDTSPSMTKSMTNTAISALRKVFGLMAPTDLFGCYTFNQYVTKLHHPIPKSRVDWTSDEEMIRKNGDYCTSVYDAIDSGIEALRGAAKRSKRDDLVLEQLVITDGDDNSSYTSLSKICKKVAHPGLSHYHLVIVAVGIDHAAREKMEKICRPDHAKFLYAKDVKDLKHVLGRTIDRIRLVLDVSDNGSRSRYTIDSDLKSAGKSLQSLAGHSKVLSKKMCRMAIQQ